MIQSVVSVHFWIHSCTDARLKATLSGKRLYYSRQQSNYFTDCNCSIYFIVVVSRVLACFKWSELHASFNALCVPPSVVIYISSECNRIRLRVRILIECMTIENPLRSGEERSVVETPQLSVMLLSTRWEVSLRCRKRARAQRRRRRRRWWRRRHLTSAIWSRARPWSGSAPLGNLLHSTVSTYYLFFTSNLATTHGKCSLVKLIFRSFCPFLSGLCNCGTYTK